MPWREVEYWYGAFTAAAVPKEIIAQLSNEIANALRSPDVITNLGKQGAAPGALTQPRFAELVRSETIKWGKVVASAGVKLD